MPEYLTPGVYVEEIDIGPKSIQSVSTSTAGFLGVTARGPVKPRLVTSMEKFLMMYGGFLENSYLAYAVDGFFRNGGQRCFIARIASDKDKTSTLMFNGIKISETVQKSLTLSAIGPGVWGERIYFKLEAASSKNHPSFCKLTVIYFSKENAPEGSDEWVGAIDGVNKDKKFVPDPTHPFNRFLKKRKDPSKIEIYDDLSLESRSPSYYKKSINGISNLITITDDLGQIDVPLRTPETQITIFQWNKIITDQSHKESLKGFLKSSFGLELLLADNSVQPIVDGNIIKFVKEGTDPLETIVPNLEIIPNDQRTKATVKLGGRTIYEFFIRRGLTNDDDVCTSNIIGLKIAPNTDGTPLKDIPVTLLDYQGHEIKINSLDGEPNIRESTGLKGFEQIDEISIVCSPDEDEAIIPGLRSELIDHCEKLKDRFAILQENQQSSNVFEDIQIERESKYAAVYIPWIRVNDPLTNTLKLIPPGGHVAGIYARSDIERGVHKAPANELVRGATSLQMQLMKEEQAILNPRGINVIRSFLGRGILVWGARTISTDPNWKYINVRRLFMFIEESIEESTQWLVFEPNSERLWSRVIATVTPFLSRLRKEGALMGTTDEEAFFIKCDRTTMTQDDIDNGRLIVMIGVAPVKPAEFVIFRIFQTRAGAEVQEL